MVQISGFLCHCEEGFARRGNPFPFWKQQKRGQLGLSCLVRATGLALHFCRWLKLWFASVEPSAATVHRTGSYFVKDIFLFENVRAAIGRPHCTAAIGGGE